MRDDECSQGSQFFLLYTGEDIAALQEGALGRAGAAWQWKVVFFREMPISALLQWLTFAYPKVT